MKIVLFNYTGNRENWGCQATSKSLLRMIKDKYTDAEIIIFELDPIESWFIPFANICTYIISWIIRYRSPYNLTILEQIAIRFIGKALYGAKFEDIKSASISILQAEGSMFLYRGKTIRLFFGPYLSMLLGVDKVVSTNQTIHTDDKRLDQLVINVFSRMSFVAVRELASLKLIHFLGVTKAILSPDAAFSLFKYPKNNKANEIRIKTGYIALSGSAKGNALPKDYIYLIKALKQNTEADIVFFAPTQPDLELGLSIAKEVDIRLIDYKEYNYIDILNLLVDAYITISGRFHFNILSLCALTPVIFLDTNTNKNQGLIDMLNWPYRICNVQITNDIINQFETVRKNYFEIKDTLRIKLLELSNKSNKNVSWL